MGRWHEIAATVALGLGLFGGLVVPALMGQGCGAVEPRTAQDAFQAVCLAALAAEAAEEGQGLPETALGYCSDPGLPGRIASLVEQARRVTEDLDLAPAPAELLDGGTR